MPNETPDWDLVAAARAGDWEAYAELVRRYERPLVHFCKRMTGSHEDAEELAQETFMRVHRYIKRLTPRAKFSTVIFGFARNLTLNHLRDSRRRGQRVPEPADSKTGAGLVEQFSETADRPDEQARLREIEQIIEAGLERLTPQHREVIVLREFQGLDYESIAEIVKCRKGTVKSRLARAREQLRLQVLELGGEVL